MSRQFFQEALAWVTASGPAVANTTTETRLVGDVLLLANYLHGERVLRLAALGSYGTTATPTVQFRLRLGGLTGTILAASGAIPTPSAAGGGASMTALWALECWLQVRTSGSAGTVMTNGHVTLYTDGTTAGSRYPLASGSTNGTTPVAVTVDLTVDAALTLSAQWGTANAANSIQLHQYLVESLN